MSRWTRTAPLASPAKIQTESWSYAPLHTPSRAFELMVYTGKPLDVMLLKQPILNDVRDYAAFLALTAQTLYAQEVKKREIEQCPCCQTLITNPEEVLKVFNIP